MSLRDDGSHVVSSRMLLSERRVPGPAPEVSGCCRGLCLQGAQTDKEADSSLTRRRVRTRTRTHTIRVNAKYRRPEQRLEERAPFTCAGDRPGPRPWKERAFDSRLLHAATCGAPASSSEDLRSRCSRPNSCPPARRTPSLEQARAPRPGQDTVSAGFSLQGGKLGRTASTCPCAPPMA